MLRSSTTPQLKQASNNTPTQPLTSPKRSGLQREAKHGRIVIVKKDNSDGYSFPLDLDVKEEILLGRDASCDITIKIDFVSRKHAKIFVEKEEDGSHSVWLQPLSSGEPTFLNEEALREVSELLHGDVISIAGRKFRFETHLSKSGERSPRSSTSANSSLVNSSSTLFIPQGFDDDATIHTVDVQKKLDFNNLDKTGTFDSNKMSEQTTATSVSRLPLEKQKDDDETTPIVTPFFAYRATPNRESARSKMKSSSEEGADDDSLDIGEQMSVAQSHPIPLLSATPSKSLLRSSTSAKIQNRKSVSFSKQIEHACTFDTQDATVEIQFAKCNVQIKTRESPIKDFTEVIKPMEDESKPSVEEIGSVADLNLPSDMTVTLAGMISHQSPQTFSPSKSPSKRKRKNVIDNDDDIPMVHEPPVIQAKQATPVKIIPIKKQLTPNSMDILFAPVDSERRSQFVSPSANRDYTVLRCSGSASKAATIIFPETNPTITKPQIKLNEIPKCPYDPHEQTPVTALSPIKAFPFEQFAEESPQKLIEETREEAMVRDSIGQEVTEVPRQLEESEDLMAEEQPVTTLCTVQEVVEQRKADDQSMEDIEVSQVQLQETVVYVEQVQTGSVHEDISTEQKMVPSIVETATSVLPTTTLLQSIAEEKSNSVAIEPPQLDEWQSTISAGTEEPTLKQIVEEPMVEKRKLSPCTVTSPVVERQPKKRRLSDEIDLCANSSPVFGQGEITNIASSLSTCSPNPFEKSPYKKHTVDTGAYDFKGNGMMVSVARKLIFAEPISSNTLETVSNEQQTKESGAAEKKQPTPPPISKTVVRSRAKKAPGKKSEENKENIKSLNVLEGSIERHKEVVAVEVSKMISLTKIRSRTRVQKN